MKIALITDTHFGVRNDSPKFMKVMSDFFSQQFFPTLKKEGIRQIVHLGDLVDRRKYVAFQTAKCLRETFIEPVIQGDYDLDIIVGNHDLPFRNIATVNAERELLPESPNIRIFDQPQECYLGNLNVLMLPWICKENEKEAKRLIETSDAPVCFGHLELAGFEQHPGSVAVNGLDPLIFSRFKKVFTGHYHHRSARENIYYLGAPYEMTWNDFNDPKGFHIFDTETLQLKYIKNPVKIHAKAYYDDSSDPELTAFSQYKDKIVKLIIKSKRDPVAYDRWVENLMEANPISVTVVDDHLRKDAPSDMETAGGVENTLTMLMGCVEEYGASCNKDALKKLLLDLYNRASELQA